MGQFCDDFRYEYCVDCYCGNKYVQVKQKHSPGGIVLGDDVLTLEVEEDTDHSLIMAFVTTYGLVCGRI